MQKAQVRSLVRKDPICHGATKSMRHNCWACAVESGNCNYPATCCNYRNPCTLEPVLWDKGSPHTKTREQFTLIPTTEKPTRQRSPSMAKNQQMNKDFLKNHSASRWQRWDLYPGSDLIYWTENLEVGGDLRDHLLGGWFHQQNVAGFHEMGLEYQLKPQTKASSQSVWWLSPASAEH